MTADDTYLATTRASYDTVAADYARLLSGALERMPLDRAMLGTFAELVGTPPDGPDSGAPGLPVADLGCGTGRVTAHLAALGVDVFGIDLSPGMIEVARQTYPELRFEVGSMLSLDLPDASLGGIVAWYSLVHTPPEQLPLIFAEFARVLAPGGHLVLAFKVGDDDYRLTEGYGHPLTLHVYRNTPDQLSELLTTAGLPVTAHLVREPDPTAQEKTPQAVLLARRAS